MEVGTATAQGGARQESKFESVCQGLAQKSFKCLEDNFGDKSKCQSKRRSQISEHLDTP